MKTQQFITHIADWFENWFKEVQSQVDSGKIGITGLYSFPDFLRVGESPYHYVVELMGAQDIIDPALCQIRRPKVTEKVGNVASFLNPGHRVGDAATALINMSAKENTLKNLTFATQFDQTKFNKRINVPINTPHFQAKFKPETLIFVSQDADKLLFRDIDLVQTKGPEIFFKRITTALVVKKTITKEELSQWLISNRLAGPPLPDILGLNTSYSVDEEGFAIQLLSLTQQDTGEDVIDTFIQKNANFFASALGYQKAINQPRLRIIDSTGLDGEYLQPDYLMLRKDGTYDILDLKKSLIPNVTVGKKTRIRFSAYVNELVSQLSGYKRYFSLQKNKEWAEKNLNISVSTNPQLLGIVGNHNNFLRENVDLVQEQLQQNITILGYSEIIDLLRKT